MPRDKKRWELLNTTYMYTCTGPLRPLFYSSPEIKLFVCLPDVLHTGVPLQCLMCTSLVTPDICYNPIHPPGLSFFFAPRVHCCCATACLPHHAPVSCDTLMIPPAFAPGPVLTVCSYPAIHQSHPSLPGLEFLRVNCFSTSTLSQFGQLVY